VKRAAIVAALAAIVLTGCGSTSDPEPVGETKLNNLESVRVYPQRLPDGRTVTCLIYTGYQKGGLSCDWAGAK
jgi:hypothetical protein